MKLPFEQVVAEHGDTVLRVCRVVVGFDDAEDAWAETFLSALRAYPDLPADANVVTPGYFEALRIPVRGRAFDARDTGGAPGVAVINGALARSLARARSTPASTRPE